MQSLNQILADVLAKAKGNKTQARKLLIQAAAQDAKLAQQLAVPFLESIAGYALDHFMRTNPDKVKATNVLTEKARNAPAAKSSTQHKATMEALIGAYKKKD